MLFTSDVSGAESSPSLPADRPLQVRVPASLLLAHLALNLICKQLPFGDPRPMYEFACCHHTAGSWHFGFLAAAFHKVAVSPFRTMHSTSTGPAERIFKPTAHQGKHPDSSHLLFGWFHLRSRPFAVIYYNFRVKYGHDASDIVILFDSGYLRLHFPTS